MDKQKLEWLKGELPSLRIHHGDTFTAVADKLVRLAEIQIALAEQSIDVSNGKS